MSSSRHCGYDSSNEIRREHENQDVFSCLTMRCFKVLMRFRDLWEAVKQLTFNIDRYREVKWY